MGCVSSAPTIYSDAGVGRRRRAPRSPEWLRPSPCAAAVSSNGRVAKAARARVPTELICGGDYFWPSLMAATAIEAIALGMAYGLLLDYVVGGFHASGATEALG